MTLGILPEPVLVGRERELEELQRCLASAKEGKGKTVFVSAEAGIGKTRLMREFLNSAKQEKNVVTLSGWCLFNAGVPYFPFIEAFSSYYSSLDERSSKEGAEISSWLKEPAKTGLSGKLEYLSPQALKDQTFVAVARTIHKIATKGPVILLIEDVHWADSASLALLHYVARAVNDSERVLVLATFRSEELTSDAEGYPHQLVETLAMMRREDLFEQISLTGLNPSCVAEMAESMLGGCVERRLAERLAVESEGNPLFVVESLRMLNERNGLVKENDEWRLAVGELGIPSKFKDIMLQRLACLNHAQRRLLDAASVIGEEFEVGLLSAVVEEDSLEVMETLNAIAHSTSLVRPDENHYRFDHARSREILYEALAQPLKRGYHSKVAQTLESVKSFALPLSDLAYHYAQAGNKEKAVKFALAAAKDELAKWSNAQAIRHFQYVLRNLAEGQTEEKRTALEGLGDAYAANSRYNEAIETFDELAASETGRVRLRALRKAMDAAYVQGDKPDLLLEYAKKAEESGVKDRLEMARVLSNRGRAYGWAGRGDVRLDLADYDSALKVFEEENSLPDVAEALLRSGQVAGIFFEDLSKKGIGELLRSVAIFRELGDVRKEIEATRWTGAAFSVDGLYQEAEREYSSVLTIGEKSDLFLQLAQASIYLGDLYELKGRIAEALAQSLKGLEFSKKTDAKWIQGVAYAYLTRQYSLLRDLKHADEYFNKMNKLPQEVLSNVNLLVIYPRTKGVYFAAHDQWEESKQSFEKFLEFVENRKTMHSFEAFTRRYYAWALERQGRFDVAKVQRDRRLSLLKEAEGKFEHADVQLSVLVPRKVQVGEELEMRIDLVNVAKHGGTLLRVEGLVPAGSKVTNSSPICQIENNSIDFNKKRIGAFQVETIKLKMIFTKDGDYKLEPRVFYVDDLGEERKAMAETITVIAQISSVEFKLQNVLASAKDAVSMSEASEKALSFLVSAFEEDYLIRRLLKEKSGWRTLMDVVKSGKVSKHSMYGRSGKGGKVTTELEQLGLVESRFFLGESGRAGRVLKVRIRYDNETIKRLLTQSID